MAVVFQKMALIIFFGSCRVQIDVYVYEKGDENIFGERT
jgi:hypothetical protein